MTARALGRVRPAASYDAGGHVRSICTDLKAWDSDTYISAP
jgi:hypothetical protein